MSDPRKPAPAATPVPDRGRELRELNDRLRELVASLRTEKDRLGEARPAATPVPLASGPAADPPDGERRRLEAELVLSREAVAAQARSTELAELYAALERLHGAASRAEALAAIQEIVVNFVGSEELAVFERRGGTLALAHAFGVAARALDALDLREGAIARAGATGRAYVAGRGAPAGAGEEDLTAAIPLKAWDGVQGVLAIFRLLGHKPGLDESDHAVFELLSAHAGVALRLRDPRAPAAG